MLDFALLGNPAVAHLKCGQTPLSALRVLDHEVVELSLLVIAHWDSGLPSRQ